MFAELSARQGHLVRVAGMLDLELDDQNEVLTEVQGPAGLCPDGRALQPLAGARRYQRSH